MTPEQQLRYFVVDHAWPAARTLVFGVPTRASLDSLVRAIFVALSGGRRLPTERVSMGSDTGLVTPEGDGMLFALRNFGAVPGDCVEEIWHMVIRNEVRIILGSEIQSSQGELTVELAATREA